MDRRPRARRRAVVAVVALLTLVAVTVTAAALAARSERDARSFELLATARQTGAVIRATIEQPTAALDGVDALLDDAGLLDHRAFQRWGAAVIPESPLLAVAYARTITDAERPAFEAIVGTPVRQLRPGGGFETAPSRPTYLPVATVTPDGEAQRTVLGFDLTSSPPRAAAVAEARRTGVTTLSAPLHLATRGTPGVGLYHPLRTPDGRVVGVLSAQMGVDQLARAVRHQLPPGVALRATDGGRQVLAVGEPGPGAVTRRVPVMGRTWELAVDQRSETTERAPSILVGGLTATAFLALVFLLWLRRDRRVEARQRLIEDLTTNTPDPILIKDRAGRYLFANDAGARALGLPDSSVVVGRTDAQVIEPGAARAIRAHDREVMGSGRPAAYEEVLHGTAGERHFLTTRSPYRDASGRVIGVFAVARDVTERRQDEQRRAAVAALAAAVGSRATVGPVAEAAAASIRRSLGADVVRVAVAYGEHHVELLAAEGAEVLEDEDRFLPLDAAHTLATALRERHPVAVHDREEWLRRYPDAGPMILAEDLQSSVSVPFTSSSQRGAVSISYRRPRDFDDEVLRTLSDLTTVLGEALARARSTELERDAVATLQHALLPVDTFPDTPLDIAVRYSPALRGLELGGDWYDVFARDDGRIGVVTGDVVGRGAAAAAVMGQLRAALRALSMNIDEPADVLRELDRFTATTDGGFCTTVVYGTLDPRTRRFTFSSAGHLPPLLWDPAGGSRYLADVRGLPLGVDPAGATRPQATVELEPGSTLVLFTDGLVERRDRAIDDGLSQLGESVDRNGQLPIEAFADRLLAIAATDAEDDTALLCLRLPGPDAGALTCRIDADLAELAAFRVRLRGWLGDRGVVDEDVDDLVLATVEAVTNSIEHGYRRDPRSQTVVELSDDGGAVTVTVRDRGRWNGRRPHRDRGRGLPIIEAVMDEARITSSRHGTTLHMVKRARRRVGAPVGA